MIEKPETLRVRSCRCYAFRCKCEIVAIWGGIGWLAAWRYTKLSLLSALLPSFSGMRFVLLLLSFCRSCFIFIFVFVFVSMLSLELCRCRSDILLVQQITYRTGSHVQILLGMVKARSVNVKDTHTHTHPPMSRLIRGFRNKYH